MNRRQKLVQEQFLNNEETVIKRLQYIYDRSLFEVNDKIRNLEFTIDDLKEQYDWMSDDDPKKEVIRSRIQSKIYQKQYQEQLQGQLNDILNKMQTQQFLTVSDYLDTCYEDGFIGTVYDMHGQGVPLMMGINQEAMVRVVQLESKINQDLYTHLGENVGVLKKNITAEVSRGISTGMSYGQVAQQIKGKMMGTYKNPKGAMAYAQRIARTEGHRIQTTAAMDAMEKAKELGADVLKQWDAALDDRTRESHVAVDGEIREVNKPFSNGLMYPGDPAGGAAEVINCRCALLQRARWALDEDELQTLKDRAAYYGLDKTEQFDDFKKNYLKTVNEPVQALVKPVFTPAKTVEEAEEYGRRFIVKKTWSGNGEISYKGLSVDNANKLNETLTDLFATYDLPLLENIKPMNFRRNIWKGSENAPFAYRSSFNGELYFNPKIAKNAKAFDDYFKKGEEAFEICKKNIDRFTGSQREMVERYVKAGRQLVADDAKDRFVACVQHEMGHHIQNQILWKNKDAIKKMNDHIDEYGVKISGYATNSKGEYVAESFCAFMNGESDKIDPFMKEYFEGLMK